MATLTQTSHYTRRLVIIFFASVIGFFVLRASILTARDIYRRIHPKPPPPPTVAFGKIPQIKFPEPKDLPELSFKLETIGGGLSTLDTVGKVYFTSQKKPGLLDLDRATQKAKLLGFNGSPEQTSEIIYRWQKNTEPITFLEINTTNGNFYLRHLYEENIGLLDKKNLPSNDQAITEAKNYLKSKKSLADDLREGRAEIVYYRFVPPDLLPAVSLSEADFIRVNLFRTDLDELRILPPNPTESLVSFLFSGSREYEERMVEIKYTYFPISRETPATYPLRPLDQAWQQLQGGQGFIASLGENPEGQITVRNVSLAYFDSGEEENFLQPIYVFQGDRNFYGYVAALDPEWVE